jgi:hypothetical protein
MHPIIKGDTAEFSFLCADSNFGAYNARDIIVSHRYGKLMERCLTFQYTGDDKQVIFITIRETWMDIGGILITCRSRLCEKHHTSALITIALRVSCISISFANGMN